MSRVEYGGRVFDRKPSPPDDRDYALEGFVTGEPIDAALQGIASKTTKAWATIATQRIHNIEAHLNVVPVTPTPPPAPNPTPAPTPTPTPVPAPSPVIGDVMWMLDVVLDQGDTGHCVGYAGADWANAMPIDDNYGAADGDKLYYEAVAIEGYPNSEDGTTVRCLAKALKIRKRLSAYAFATKFQTIVDFVRATGPIVFGTDWYESMMDTDAHGVVRVSGRLLGGHAYLCVGDRPSVNRLRFANSWGVGWGDGGFFEMSYSDAQKLFAADGEAMAAVELPL